MKTELRYDLFTVLDLLMNDILKKQDIDASKGWHMRYGLICSDGFTVSVQMSHGHYCNPRESGLDSSMYSAVELGYPSEPEEQFLQYAEDRDNPTDTVYSYVPMETVQEVFLKHGGLHPKEVIRLKKIQKQLENR